MTAERMAEADLTDQTSVAERPATASRGYSELDAIPDVVLRCDRRGGIHYVNPVVLQRSGRPREHFVGRTLTDLDGPAALMQRMLDLIGRCLDQGREEWLDFQWPRPSGEVVVYDCRVVPEPAPEGPPRTVLCIARDVTARRAAERELALVGAFVESTPDAVVGCDPQQRINAWNPAAARLFGYARDEALGQPLAMLAPEGERQRMTQLCEVLRQGQAFGEVEAQRVRKDGSLVEVAIIGAPMLDAQRRVVGTAAVIRDITQRRQAERSLELQRRALSERVRELRCLYSVSTCLADAGADFDAALARLPDLIVKGWQRPEATGVRLALGARVWETASFDCGPWCLHEPIRAGDAVLGQLEIAYLDEQLPEPIEDDQLGPFLSDERALARDIAARIAEMVLRHRAEQALTRREAFWRSLVEGLLDVITVIRPDGTVVYASPSMRQAAGFSPDELIGADIFDFIHPDDRAAAVRAVLSPTPEMLEYRFLHKDGHWIYAEGRGAALADGPEGQGVVIVSRVITERKEAEAQRAALEAQLRQAQKMEAVGRLAGGIAHDFNNLLTVIQAATAMLLEQLPSDGPARVDAEEIAHAADRAASLTSQLLTFSRRGVVRVVPIDLRDAVRDAERMLRRIIGEDLQLKTRAAAGVGRVSIDPGQLQQVILNLAVNAREAMPKGGELTIALRPSPEPPPGFPLAAAPEHGWAILEVRDTGEGIAPEHLDKIFEPFFTTKPHGTGLGLATVYGIVQQAGGLIDVQSTPGQGTTASVYLPRLPAPQPSAAPAPARGPAAGTETILLVEDEDHLRRLARRVLERAGYRVLDAPNAIEALTLSSAHDGPIHLLLTDVVMPGPSGPELAERLAPLRPDTRVLFTSGYADTSIAGRHLHHGTSAFLPKPFTPDSLTTKVREVLDAPAS